MRRIRPRYAVAAVAVLGLAGLAGCDYPPDGRHRELTIVGATVPQDLMGHVARTHNSSTDPFFLAYNDDPDVPGDDRDTLWNVPAPGSTKVPADPDCVALDWGGPGDDTFIPVPNPASSSAGREALKDNILTAFGGLGAGCIDIVRSTFGPRPTGTGGGQDLESFEYYAYALDAVSWSTASTLAPANLTLAQLRGIYDCTFTNWNQVGGGSGPIQRYWPTPGSDTRAFFQSAVLGGFDPVTISTANCPQVIITLADNGQEIADNGHTQTALMPFSASRWVAMARGEFPDQRAGQVIGSLNGQRVVRFDDGQAELAVRDSEFPTAPVNEENTVEVDPTPAYPGIRFLHNVISTESPAYGDAKRYVGFRNVDNGNTSPLCNGRFAALIEDLGFGPLDRRLSAINRAGSTCRALSVPDPAVGP